MGNENSKRMNNVSEGHGKVSRILSLAVLVTLLATTLSVSFTAIAETEEKVDIDALRAQHKTYYTPSEAIGDVVSAVKAGERPERAGLPMTMIPIEGLENLLQPGYANNPPEPKATNPTPTGGPGPSPNDAPFLANDILVYANAESQRNVSMAHFDNGDLLVSYDTVNPGDGLRDLYVSMSTDGGSTWNDYPIAADVGEDEACGSIAGDYSPIYGSEMFYAFYNNPTLEFSWSTDGMTWAPVDTGMTFWSTVSCPYVVVDGDFIFLAAQKYDDQTLFQDTWYILYTLDNFQTTFAGYYWLMWEDGLSYRPRATIVDSATVMTVVDIFDQTDPNPANWWHQSLMAYGELVGDPDYDVWPYWVWGSGFYSQIYTNPTIASDGAGAVAMVETTLDPIAIPLSTSQLFCAWTSYLQGASTEWRGCNNDAFFLAFDGDDLLDQKYPHFHREASTIHAVWVNGTDINYKYSPDGGLNWNGDPATGDPMKVIEVGVGTHLDEWHSPDVDSANGKPVVAWHDDRGNDDIYFQSFGNVIIFTVSTQPLSNNLPVRADGGPWKYPPASYMWPGGTNHDVEATPSFEITDDTRYTFSHWDDGSNLNPHTITVDGVDNDIVAIYDVEYWLEMVNAGATTPASGYQMEDTVLTIEAFEPAAPPGGRYVWVSWTGVGAGSYTGPDNPCTNCVTMNGTVTQIANWQLQWNVTFDTIPTGRVIEINGQPYTTTTPHYHWLNDSEMYSINAPSPQSGGPGLRYVWSNWSDSGPQLHNVFVIGAGESFVAAFTPEYWLTVDTNVAGLEVTVDGSNYPAPYSFWCQDGDFPWLSVPSPQYLGVSGERYVWASWSTGGALTHMHTCDATETVTANFVMQRSVNVTTNPTGFSVIVDGQTRPAPAQFWWNDTTVHTIEAPDTVPAGATNRYKWVSWSDLGARVHDVTPDTSDLLLTANYVYQHRITFQANEPGLSINIDSVPYALPYVHWCDDGATLILEAPDIQTFGDTRYLWSSWSDGLAITHNYVCIAPAIVQVNYDKEYKVYINTTLDAAGSTLDIIAGGVTYSTPAEVWWPAGDPMTLDTTEFQPGQDPISGIRFRYVDWDDSAIKDHTVTIDAAGKEYVANFKTQYRLTFDDPNGSPTTTPAGEVVTGGLYFDMGASVAVETDDIVADTDHRYRFDAWSSPDAGGYNGTDNPATITMLGPITMTADWVEQYLLTIVSAHGTPDAGGYYEKVTGATQYWYDKGDTATFWVEAEVSTGTGEKAVFESWSGANGTAMNAPLTVTATWHNEYFVAVDNGGHGTASANAWVEEGDPYALSIDELVTDGDTRYVFDGWQTADTAHGGYAGDSATYQMTAVTGPITETATWITQHRLTIVSESGDETGIGDPRTVPPGQEWIAEGSQVNVEVDKSVEIDPNKYTFDGWLVTGGTVADSTSPSTQVTVNGPTVLTVEWKSEPLFSVMDLWWLFVIIIIIVVVLIAVLLMRRKKPAEEELPPPEEEEFLEEEPPAPPE